MDRILNDHINLGAEIPYTDLLNLKLFKLFDRKSFRKLIHQEVAHRKRVLEVTRLRAQRLSKLEDARVESMSMLAKSERERNQLQQVNKGLQLEVDSKTDLIQELKDIIAKQSTEIATLQAKAKDTGEKRKDCEQEGYEARSRIGQLFGLLRR